MNWVIKMRFRVEVDFGKKIVIPYDHQYHLASYIYNRLADVDPTYAEILHQSKEPKPYTFSYLMVEKREVYEKGIISKDGKAYFFISSPDKKFLETLINGMFSSPRFKLGEYEGVITEVRVLKPPDFSNSMEFKTLSPILVRKPVDSEKGLKAKDLYPSDLEFYTLLKKNLTKRYRSFYGEDSEGNVEIEFLEFKPKRHRILNTFHRCVLGKFKIFGDKKLIQFGYEAGFGEKGSMGFGMVKTM